MSATNKLVRVEQESPETDDGEQCVAASEAVLLFKDKWTILVLGSLSHAGSLRYNELQRRVIGISQRMLTLTLRGLERDGLLTRTVYPTIPPRVEYTLTPLGRSLSKPVASLGDWALKHREEIEAAKREFDRREEPAAIGLPKAG